MRNSAVTRFSWLLGLVLGCIWNMAYGGGLSVNPIRIFLSESAPTAALTLENTGAAPMVIQLRLMHWTAAGEGDSYEPSEDIVAMPPIMTIRPGQPQIVRVGLSRSPDPNRELAYRLFFEEVPPPPKLGYQGVQIALRVGVPVFVSPVKSGHPELRWRVVRARGNAVTVYVTNVGNDHAQLTKITLRGSRQDRNLAEQQVVGYLLPGQARHWVIQLKEALPEGRVRLSAGSDLGVTDVDLDVETP